MKETHIDSYPPTLTWEIKVSLLSNKHVLKQVFIGLQIALAFLMIILLAIQFFDPYTRVDGVFLLNLIQIYGIVFGIMAVCMILGVALAYGFGYHYCFSINEKGIQERPSHKQAHKNKFLHRLTLVLSIFAKNPTTAGASMIAQSRQSVFLTWKDITKIEVGKKQRTYILKKGKFTKMLVFCHKDNFEQVGEILFKMTQGSI